MSKTKRTKKDKQVSVSYFGYNITLRSDKRKGENAYLELIKLVRDIGYVQISPDKAITVKTYAETSTSENGTNYTIVYGRLIKFTLLEGDNWYNSKNRDVVKYTPPEGVYPNAFETDFVFIPYTHRFYLKISPKFASKSVFAFLLGAFSQVITADEIVNVSIIQSSDVIETILTSRELKALNVVVSYTNDDIGPDAQELIDGLLKEAHSGKTEIALKPDQSGNLNTDSKLVKGFLEVAKENGEATASIINLDGKKQTIVTANHPEKIKIVSTSQDNNKAELFKDTVKKYRNELRNEVEEK